MIQLRHALTRFVPARVAPSKRGFRVLYVIAAVVDATVEFGLQGLLARFPGLGTPTALSDIGRDRLIPRGRTEPAAAYALRLQQWRTAHKRAGNPYLEMEQLQASFAPAKPALDIINSHSTWYTLQDDGTRTRELEPVTWNWDGLPALWSRFWSVIWSLGGSPWERDGTWDSGDTETWDEAAADGTTWGSSATQDQIRDVFAVFEHWRSHGAKLEHVLVQWEALATTPDGTWGASSASRDPAAVYWRPESL